MARTGLRKATIYDVAADANSSPATVSLVLSGNWARYRIKDETAQRISEAAHRLGYRVNLVARGLRLSHSGLAGMILPHYRNRFFADLAEEFEEEARRRNLCPIVVSTLRDERVEISVTRTLLAQRVEFLFVAGVRRPEPLNQLCATAGLGCVNLDLPGDEAPSVVSDNRGGARRLTDVLIEKVVRRGGSPHDFFFLGGVMGDYATDNRAAGFTEALHAHGASPGPDDFSLCGHYPTETRDALDAFVARRGRLPGGLFINSIACFEGALASLSALPPATLNGCVVGCFDWDPFAACLPFEVTMMRQDTQTMIRHAFEALAPERQENRLQTMIPTILI